MSEITKVQRHRAKCLSMNALYEKKNHDYGDSFGETFRKLGIISAATRITDKYNRFISLATGKEQKVADETMKDTLIDMANYAIMTLIELEDMERQKSKVEVQLSDEFLRELDRVGALQSKAISDPRHYFNGAGSTKGVINTDSIAAKEE